EAAEWRCDDPARAETLLAAALGQADIAAALAELARLRSWRADWAAAVDDCEKLAALAIPARQRIEVLRTAASLHGHRLAAPEKAAARLRQVVESDPSDVEAI